MPDPLTISECTIDQLLSELTLRCPCGVVSVQVPDDGNTRDPQFFMWGDRSTALGLAELGRAYAMQDATGQNRMDTGTP